MRRRLHTYTQQLSRLSRLLPSCSLSFSLCVSLFSSSSLLASSVTSEGTHTAALARNVQSLASEVPTWHCCSGVIINSLNIHSNFSAAVYYQKPDIKTELKGPTAHGDQLDDIASLRQQEIIPRHALT